MQFEKFSNTKIDESIKGQAIKQGLKTAARKTKIGAKKFVKAVKKDLNKPATKGDAIKKGLAGGSTAVAAHELVNHRTNEQLIESIKSSVEKVKSQNEAAIGAALKGIGSKASTAAGKAFQGAKEVSKNTVAGAKKIGSSIKAHPVRTAAVAGAGLAGYGAYKGVKKATGTGKKAYNNWNM